MEDFDYIDALAKSELSDRTATPSADGWEVVQQKMKRKKRKRLVAYLFLFALLGSLGMYIGVHITSDSGENTISNTSSEQFKSTNATNTTNVDNTNTIVGSDTNSSSSSDSNTDSTKIADDDTSQAGTNTSGTHTVITAKNQDQTTNNVHGAGNGITQKQTGNHSRFNTINNNSKLSNASKTGTETADGTQLSTNNMIAFVDGEENFSLHNAGVKLYDWKLISPDKLEKKRKKRKKSKKKDEVYENLDLMVGLNGFISSNDDYKLSGSYVVALSYTDEKKLKNDYYFKYGASLQFRNLRFKNDSVSFNKGELSMNFLSSVEKRFGSFGIEAGAYAGYEFYSPNNERFADSNTNFFERKINYGLLTSLNYNKIGLIFRYELSPYINHLGDKKFGAFTIGLKYDF